MPWDSVGQIVGPPGDPGTSVTLLAPVANAAALPASGNNAGDARMTEDDGHLHFWDGSAWSDVGQFQGPSGTVDPASLISADADNAIAQGTDNLLFSDTVTPEDFLSSDANNLIALGSDGGFFAPEPSAIDPASLVSTDAGNLIIQGGDNLLYVSDDIGLSAIVDTGSVAISGTGAASSPLQAVAVLSADAGNQTVFGSDGGIFTPAGLAMPGGQADQLTSYTVAETDGGGLIRAQSRTGDLVTVTLPDNSSWADGFVVGILSIGSAAVTIAPSGGMVIFESKPGEETGGAANVQLAPGAFAWCRKVALGWDVWWTPPVPISTDADNAIVLGSDNGLFVPPFSGLGINNSQNITFTGVGTVANPLTANIQLSADANNAAVFGGDGGLFVPESTAPPAADLISADAQNKIVAGSDNLLYALDGITATPSATINFSGAGSGASPLTADVNVSALISADAGNVLLAGSDSLLLVPPGVFNMDGGQADLQANYTLSGTDSGGLLRASAQGIDITVPEPATFVDGFIVGILNVAGEAVTVTPASNVDILASTPGTPTSNVGTTITMQTGAFLWLRKTNNSVWDAWGSGISWTS